MCDKKLTSPSSPWGVVEVDIYVEVAVIVEMEAQLTWAACDQLHQLLGAAPEEPTIGCLHLLSEYATLLDNHHTASSFGFTLPEVSDGLLWACKRAWRPVFRRLLSQRAVICEVRG